MRLIEEILIGFFACVKLYKEEFMFIKDQMCSVCCFAGKALSAFFLREEKNIYEILVFDREFPRDPHRLFGDFENAPLSGLHSAPRARRAALGDFQNPLRAQGIWMKIPSQKPEFSI